MIKDIKVIERLAAYGFIADKMKDNDCYVINSALIAYATRPKLNPMQLISKMISIASKYNFSLNYTLLQKVRTAAIERSVTRKEENKKVEEKRLFNIIPVKHEIVNRNYSEDRAKAIANNYQERKSVIIEKTDPILCTCTVCGETVNNENDLKLFFGVNMQNRKVKMICLDCK